MKQLSALLSKIAFVLCLAVFLGLPELAQAEQVGVCGTHHVKYGETLSGIAESELHHARMYQQIATANNITRPDFRIYAGTDLLLPCMGTTANKQIQPQGVDAMNLGRQNIRRAFNATMTLASLSAVFAVSQPQALYAQTPASVATTQGTKQCTKTVPCGPAPQHKLMTRKSATHPVRSLPAPAVAPMRQPKPTPLGEMLVQLQLMNAETQNILAKAVLAGNTAQEMYARTVADDHERTTMQEQNNLAIATALGYFGQSLLLQAQTDQGRLNMEADFEKNSVLFQDRAMTLDEHAFQHNRHLDWSKLPAEYVRSVGALGTFFMPSVHVSQASSNVAQGGQASSASSAVASQTQNQSMSQSQVQVAMPASSGAQPAHTGKN